MKNIVFLTVDSLTHRALGYSGHKPSPSPTFDRLAQQGLALNNMFSTGSVTQFSLPSVFTSTLPLDYGGYDAGIRQRPTSIAEIFSDQGYRTAAFTTAYWQDPMHGYNRGFDEYFSLIDMSMFLGAVDNVYLKHYKREFEDIDTRVEAAAPILIPYLERVFERTPAFCREKMSETDSEWFRTSPTIHEWMFEEIKERFNAEREKFNKDPKSYIFFLLSDGNSISSIFSDLDTKELPEFQTNNGYKVGSVYGVKNYNNILSNSGSFVTRIPHYLWNIFLKSSSAQQTRVPSAAYVFDNSLRWIDSNQEYPFFLWIHLMDVHSLNYTSWEYSDATIDSDRNNSLELLQSIRKEKGWKGNPYYDFAVQYVDSQLSQFINSLEERDLLSETSIAILADHGHYNAERPYRSSASISDFFDERYHIPTILYNFGINSSVSTLHSSLDIGPTLFDILEFNVPDSFQGRSVFADGERECILMEHAGQGPCDIHHKDLHLGVRTKNAKYVFKNQEITEVYDIKNDPKEFDNIVADTNMNDINNIREIAEKRIQKIHEQYSR